MIWLASCLPSWLESPRLIFMISGQPPDDASAGSQHQTFRHTNIHQIKAVYEKLYPPVASQELLSSFTPDGHQFRWFQQRAA
jgi:hypothetical protein